MVKLLFKSNQKKTTTILYLFPITFSDRQHAQIYKLLSKCYVIQFANRYQTCFAVSISVVRFAHVVLAHYKITHLNYVVTVNSGAAIVPCGCFSCDSLSRLSEGSRVPYGRQRTIDLCAAKEHYCAITSVFQKHNT